MRKAHGQKFTDRGYPLHRYPHQTCARDCPCIRIVILSPHLRAKDPGISFFSLHCDAGKGGVRQTYPGATAPSFSGQIKRVLRPEVRAQDDSTSDGESK